MNVNNYTKEKLEILDFVQNSPLSVVLQEAEKSRKERFKNTIYLCSIINAKSGKCSENCAYCAQSSFHKTTIQEYPLLSKEEILEQAFAYAEQGASQFSIVTSGHSPSKKELEIICETGLEVKNKTNLNLCCSLGILNNEQAKALKDAGFERYHHNLETAESHFPNICTTHTYEDSIETIKNASKQGFSVCSGGIFGMGETWTQRLEFATTIERLPIDSVPINFLNPIAGTRLENQSILSSEEALRIIALFRLLLPNKHIGICGGREKSLQDAQSYIFEAGANGIMIGNYLTTAGRSIADDLKLIKDNNLNVKPI
jgi:biotin synthase